MLHLEDERRDSAFLLALGELFQSAGFRVIFSTRRTTPVLLDSLPFEAAVIPTPEHIPYEAYPQLSRRTRIYMLPTEGAIFEEKPLLLKYAGGTRPERWTRQIENIHRFFLWGEYSRRVLMGTGRFKEEQLVVMGSPRLDFFLSDRPGPPPDFPIGLISDFVVSNSCDRQHIFQKMDELRQQSLFYHGPARNAEDRFWLEHSALRVCLDLLDECQRRKQRVSLRIHQRENLSPYAYLLRKYAGILSTEGNRLPFEAWLDQVGIVAGFNSTTFFEIVAAGIPGVNLEGLIGPRLAEHTDHYPQTHYPIMDHVPTPSSREELFAWIEQVRRKDPAVPFQFPAQARAILQDVCHFPRPVTALAQIVQTIRADLGETPRVDRGSWRGESWARAKARALELYTFQVRRDPTGNCWFPLREKQLRRQHAGEIRRYLQAAQTRPFAGVPSEPVPCAASQSS